MTETDNAADQLQSGPEEQMEGDREDTYFLPEGALEGKEVKAGDIIKFRVVGKGDDGSVEVECMDDSDKGRSEDWRDEMRREVNPTHGNY